MSETNTVKTDFWDRVWWLWSLILYATLLFAAVEVLFDDRFTAAQKGQMGILTVVFALWHAAFIYYIRSHASDFSCDRARYRVPALIYLAGAIGLWFALALRSPDFNLILAGLPPQVFSYLRLKWAIPSSIVLIGMATYLHIPDIDAAFPSFDSPWLWFFLVASAAGIILGL